MLVRGLAMEAEAAVAVDVSAAYELEISPCVSIVSSAAFSLACLALSRTSSCFCTNLRGYTLYPLGGNNSRHPGIINKNFIVTMLTLCIFNIHRLIVCIPRGNIYAKFQPFLLLVFL